MGRAIDMENRQDDLERRLKLVEDAMEEMIQTRVHHVDLTERDANLTEHERMLRAEGIEVTPDEEFTPPAGRRKIKKSKAKTVSA